MDSNGLTHCDQLTAAGLEDLVLLRKSDAYLARETSYWAANIPLYSNCIFQPRRTKEVSRVVKVLAKADGPVALRSGGHTQWPYSVGRV